MGTDKLRARAAPTIAVRRESVVLSCSVRRVPAGTHRDGRDHGDDRERDTVRSAEGMSLWGKGGNSPQTKTGSLDSNSGMGHKGTLWVSLKHCMIRLTIDFDKINGIILCNVTVLRF